MFLRDQARRYGADESWIPEVPPYGERAVEYALRGIPTGSTPERWEEAVLGRLEGHVEAAARRTVADAVSKAPSSVPLVEGLEHLDENLDGFPEKEKKEIVREVAESEKRRPRRTLAEALGEVAERVGEALDELDEAGIKVPRETREGAPSSRRSLDGKVIARPFAWARVVHPSENGPCGFCVMLASRGPVYSSSQTAGLRADAFHDHCHCTVVPVFTSREWEGKAAQEEAARTYDEVVRKGRLHGREAVNAMNREMYRRRKR